MALIRIRIYLSVKKRAVGIQQKSLPSSIMEETSMDMRRSGPQKSHEIEGVTTNEVSRGDQSLLFSSSSIYIFFFSSHYFILLYQRCLFCKADSKGEHLCWSAGGRLNRRPIRCAKGGQHTLFVCQKRLFEFCLFFNLIFAALPLHLSRHTFSRGNSFLVGFIRSTVRQKQPDNIKC